MPPRYITAASLMILSADKKNLIKWWGDDTHHLQIAIENLNYLKVRWNPVLLWRRMVWCHMFLQYHKILERDSIWPSFSIYIIKKNQAYATLFWKSQFISCTLAMSSCPKRRLACLKTRNYRWHVDDPLYTVLLACLFFSRHVGIASMSDINWNLKKKKIVLYV